MTQQRRGSVCIMSAVEPGVIAMQWTDKWSVFDRGPSEQEISGMGAARCACAVKSFELTHAAGVPTHFIAQVGPTMIHVHEFSIPNQPLLSGRAEGRVLPLEWIYRMRVMGSLLRRVKSGEIKPEELGFDPGTEVTDGMRLPHPRLECTTKFEEKDRHLSDDEARELAGLTDEQRVDAWYLVERGAEVITKAFAEVGFDIPDGKGEIGITRLGTFVWLDKFGTQDENRIIDMERGDVCSKDIIRIYLESLPWKAELDAAKEMYPNGISKWPPYPELPKNIVNMVAARYAEVARRYAGVNV